MKIAFINEDSQKNKNNFIFHILKKVASKYHHEVFNYGVKDDEYSLDYVKAGVLAGILLGTKSVDFVIMGCSTGEGIMLTANKMPHVVCGLITDCVTAELFLRINGGNAVSIPFGINFGVGFEIKLTNIFESLFKTKINSGYPLERKEIQDDQRKEFKHIMHINELDLYDVLDVMDKDFLYSIISNPYFEENFFANCQDDRIASLLKDLVDSWI